MTIFRIKEPLKYLYQQEAGFLLRSRDLQESSRYYERDRPSAVVVSRTSHLRQGKEKGCSFAFLTDAPDGSTVQMDDLLHCG